MTRAEKLRRALPAAAPDDLVGRLAGLPAATVADLVAALRLAHRAGRAHEVAARRQRIADRRRFHHVQDDDLAAAAERQVAALARRAAASPDALSRLREHYAGGPAVLAVAVAGARAHGYSDRELAATLNVSRQAVSQRFPRQDHLAPGQPDDPAG